MFEFDERPIPRLRALAQRGVIGLQRSWAVVVPWVSAQRSELVVCGALLLWVWGLWPVSRALATGAPAAILVWYALPQRPPFIRRGKG